MTEINNNIHNYGYKIDKIETKKEDGVKQNNEIPKEAEGQQYLPDTGVLGRSQIYGIKGSNISKSVEETVEMAKNCPVKMGCCEAIFDNRYQNYIESGLSESDAYMNALLDEEEFLDLASTIKR